MKKRIFTALSLPMLCLPLSVFGEKTALTPQIYDKEIRGELIILCIVWALLAAALAFVACLLLKSASRERKNKRTALTAVVSIFLVLLCISIPFCCRVKDYAADLSRQAYIQYEGVATVNRKTVFPVFGNPFTNQSYIITFTQNGKQITLRTKKALGAEGEFEKVCLVYSENSKLLLDFKINH